MAWGVALVLAVGAGAFVAIRAAGAGFFESAAPASPVLQRLLDLPATLAAAVAVGAALLGIARVGEDRASGWLPALAAQGTPAGFYPLALTASICTAVMPVHLAATASFVSLRLLLTGTSPSAGSLLLQSAVAAAACLAACSYGIWLAVVVRSAGAAAIAAAALYAVPLVPAVLIAHGGGDPGAAVWLLALPLPAPAAGAAVELLVRHLIYGTVALAGLSAMADRLFGRWS